MTDERDRLEGETEAEPTLVPTQAAEQDPDPAPAPVPTPTPNPNPNPTPTPNSSTASYFEKVVRYIPATLNAAYIASLGLLAEAAPNPAWLYWAVFLTLWALVPFYVLYIPGQLSDKSVSKRFCVMAGVISFAVWAYAVDGGPIAVSFPEYYKPLYGSLLLIVTTLILPVLEIVLKQLSFFKPESE